MSTLWERDGGGTFFCKLASMPYPAIDGAISPGEWSAANSSTITLNGFSNPSWTITANWSYMNDGTDLYIALNFSVATTFLVLDIDDSDDHHEDDGGDDYIRVDTSYFDRYWSHTAGDWLDDTGAGGTKDGTGARSSDAKVYEVRKPLRSGDSHDISAMPGRTIGFRIETYSGGDYYRFPQNTVDHDLNHNGMLDDELLAWMDLVLADTPNTPPVLDNGGVSPSAGNVSTSFVFQVTYTDAENDTPAPAWVVIDGISHAMSSADHNYSDGSIFTYSTTLKGGSHNHYFNFSDGRAWARLPASGAYDGPDVEIPAPPTISGGTVVPANGTLDTIFRYKVRYNDSNNDPPIVHKVKIDDARYDMTTNGANFRDGCEYIYDTTLSPGNHYYSFFFGDTTGTVSLPVAGNIPGPTVMIPNRPPALSNGRVSPANGSHGRRFAFSVDWEDPDGDGPQYMRLFIYITPVLGEGRGPGNKSVNLTLDSADGLTYTCLTLIEHSTCQFHFEASDGEFAARYPAGGNLSGPVLENGAPRARIKEGNGPFNVSAGTLLEFNASGSSDPDNDALRFTWTLDGHARVSTTARLSFEPPVGDHNLTLNVSDDYGLYEMIVIRFSIWQPLARLTAAAPKPDAARPKEGQWMNWTVTITNEGDVASNATDLIWTLDGTAVNSTPVPPIQPGKTALARWSWTSLPGNHTVTVRIGDSENSSNLDVVANRPPDAAIDATVNALVKKEVSFSAARSGDLDGTIVRYRWDFGDGGTAEGVSTTHIYNRTGVYIARLTVTDDNGANSTAVQNITVKSPPAPAQKGFIPGLGGVMLIVVMAVAAMLRRRCWKGERENI